MGFMEQKQGSDLMIYSNFDNVAINWNGLGFNVLLSSSC